MAASSKAATTAPTSDQPRPPHPFIHATLLSKLLFIWPNTFMNKKQSDGSHSIIQECELPEVLPNDSSQKNLDSFRLMWDKEKERAAKVMERHHLAAALNGDGNKKTAMPQSVHPSLRRAYAMDFLKTLWFVQPIMGLAAVCRMVQAVALGYLLQSFELQDERGYLWAGVMVASGFVVLMEHHHVFFWTWRRG
jgi:ATP-binding cassette subfamily C (CFTR/MRP) protein 4